MELTVEKKWACLQRREWHLGPFGAIERLPVALAAYEAEIRNGSTVCIFFGSNSIFGEGSSGTGKHLLILLNVVRPV